MFSRNEAKLVRMADDVTAQVFNDYKTVGSSYVATSQRILHALMDAYAMGHEAADDDAEAAQLEE